MKLGLTALAAALLLPTIAGAQTLDTSNWDKVVAAAKQEGTLVLYASTTGDMHEGAISGFEKAYGIKIQLVGGRGNEFPERMRTEQIAGRYNGDVTINGTDTIGNQMKIGNVVAHPPLPNLTNIVSKTETVDDVQVPVFYATYAILENTDLVKPDQEPQSWLDLLDPKWKGKMIIDDPRVISAGNTRFRTMIQNFGEDYEKKFAAQQPLVSLDIGASERRLAQGEYPLLLPDNNRFYLNNLAKGGPLPIKMKVPKEGAVGSRFDAALAKNAPHPNAAALFLNWIESPEPQLFYARTGQVPVVKDGVIDKLDPKIQPLLNVSILKGPESSRQSEFLQKAKEMYGAN